MKNEFLLAITQLAAERNLPREVVFSAVEAALASAYKKDELGAHHNIAVKIHPTSGEVKVYAQKTVVEETSDLSREISLAEAQRLKTNIQLGDVVDIETKPPHGGRIAAQTAKQVVLQRLREAEREFIFGEYTGQEEEIISAVVHRVEPRQVIIDLGKAEGILPISEQVRTEHYRVGQRLKVYLLEVNRTSKGPRLIVSRTHANLVRRLFELEIPEIANGIIEIKAIAREAGFRSKVAVVAHQEGIDAVGSCVGLRGIRIQNVVNELGGERIDVVQWSPDPRTFIASALSPAQVLSVETNEQEKVAAVIVPDGQISLAIGREGQNARLAAKISGWKIDIKSASVAEEERAQRAALEAKKVSAPAPAEEAEEPELLQTILDIPGIRPTVARAVLSTLSPEKLAQAVSTADIDTMSTIPGVGKKTAETLILGLEGKLGAVVAPPAEEVEEAQAPAPTEEPAIPEPVEEAAPVEEAVEELPEEEEEVIEIVGVELARERPQLRFAEDIFEDLSSRFPGKKGKKSKKEKREKRAPKAEASKGEPDEGKGEGRRSLPQETEDYDIY